MLPFAELYLGQGCAPEQPGSGDCPVGQAQLLKPAWLSSDELCRSDAAAGAQR